MKLIRKTVIFFFALTTFLLMNVGLAVEVRNINSATVVVPDQSPQTLQKELPQALSQVLVRMSGNTGIMTLPAIQNAFPKINNYVEKYSYTTDINNDGKPQLKLQVVFDISAVKQLLKSANQAIWGTNRPLTMVWVSVLNGAQPEILASGDQNIATQAIKQAALSRGVPIIFPAMDLEDQTDVAQSTSTLLTNRQLQTISQRYGVDCVLAGAIVTDGNGELQGEWQLFLNGTPYEWQTSGGDVMQIMANGIDRAADMMAGQFATIDNHGMENFVTMQVNGVRNLDDYVHVVSTLKRLTPVAKVSVSDMTDDMLLLKIKIAGSLQDLVNALKSVSHLAVETAPPQTGLNAGSLFYRWKTNSQTAVPETITTSSSMH